MVSKAVTRHGRRASPPVQDWQWVQSGRERPHPWWGTPGPTAGSVGSLTPRLRTRFVLHAVGRIAERYLVALLGNTVLLCPVLWRPASERALARPRDVRRFGKIDEETRVQLSVHDRAVAVASS